MSSNLTLSQLQSKLATSTGLLKRVLTNQIKILIESQQALIPAPPPARAPITRKRLTVLEQLKLSEFKYSTPQRGYLLYNPVKDTYIQNTKLNRANVNKQIDLHNEQLYSSYYLQQLHYRLQIYHHNTEQDKGILLNIHQQQELIIDLMLLH